MPGIFITGTDTGCGKTYITALLAEYFIEQGIDVGIFKPIACGPRRENDAIHLKKRLKIKDPLDLINPIRLKLPLSPFSASIILKKKINFEKIFRSYQKLCERHQLVLVEGVGGALVPLTKNYYVADLIKDLGIPAIVVARAGLGTINHTLLTCEALKSRKVEVLGIIMNGFKKREISEKSNAEIINKLTKLPIMAKIKFQPSPSGRGRELNR